MIATSEVQQLYSHANFGEFNYNSNADCDWIIEADPGRNVQLTFKTFDVRFSISIYMDFGFDVQLEVDYSPIFYLLFHPISDRRSNNDLFI